MSNISDIPPIYSLNSRWNDNKKSDFNTQQKITTQKLFQLIKKPLEKIKSKFEVTTTVKLNDGKLMRVSIRSLDSDINPVAVPGACCSCCTAICCSSSK